MDAVVTVLRNHYGFPLNKLTDLVVHRMGTLEHGGTVFILRFCLYSNRSLCEQTRIGIVFCHARTPGLSL